MFKQLPILVGQDSSIPIPVDQHWIINRMKALGYNKSSSGVCFGISHMAMQAVLAGELDQFYKRFELISAIPLGCDLF